MKKKILQIVDVEGWAIDRLASAIVEHNPQFEWKRIFVHPRDIPTISDDALKQIKEAVEWCDLIDAEYWRTFTQLRDKIPLIKEKFVVITHHNEENILTDKWEGVDMIIAKTNHSKELLNEAGYDNVVYIPNSYDPRVFSWNENYPPTEFSVGYAGRIVRWKGLKEIAQACYELGVPLKVMGKMEDQTYFDSIPEDHRMNIDWSYFQYPTEKIQDFYKDISVFVCNSGPGREVGPLPVIEAMASGVPVVSTRAGLVADIGVDRENMLLVSYDSVEGLKQAIGAIKEDKEIAQNLRDRGWRTIKNYTDGMMSRAYSKIFYNMLTDGQKLVSVIIPATFERIEKVKEIVTALENQTYKSLELIIVWDEELIPAEVPWEDTKTIKSSLPIIELVTKKSGYNLAMARNLGVIEAQGEILVLCDSRFKPEPDGINKFIETMNDYGPDDKVWIFGHKIIKGVLAMKKSFVENWSCIRRRQLIDSGMFNERVDEYGGMSQELRSRFMAQGYGLVFCPEAVAKEMIKSTSKGGERRGSMIRMKELMNKLGFVN